MTRFLLVAMAVLLLSCQLVDKKAPDSGLQGFAPDAEASERADCTKRGGAYSKAGLSGGLICVETTKDAGKTCTAATQCDGLCLARSGTCAPVKPLFGCNEIFTNNGSRATICID